VKEKLFEAVETLMPEMTDILSDLCAIPAVSPLAGGEGEYKKAQYLAKKIKELGLGEPQIIDCPDPQAAGGVRPNLLVTIPGLTKQRLVIVAHMDVVPAGDLSLWHTDPFKAVVRDGRIYGRGVNDNCQELVSSLCAVLALKKLGVTPKYEICLCFVADEEVGSDHGIKYLIEKNIFKKDDLIIVPDGGDETGLFIEVAEKSILWAEFEVTGKQVHGSTPQLGNNACRAGSELAIAVDRALHEAFPDEDRLFDPPVSTFEPTRRAANVPNINTVPGRDLFCFDCRVLPSIPLEKVIAVIDAEIKKIERKRGVKVERRFYQNVQAPAPTPAGAPIVNMLKAALRQVIPGEPRVSGVGGGTCAAYFRAIGIPAAVWDQEVDCAHMPNEYAELKHIENEAKVFALMMTGA